MRTQRAIRFGVFPSPVNATWPDLRRAWQTADELGYSTAWIPDHFYAGFGSMANPTFEAWTTIAATAGVTKRIRVGVMVSGNTYRHPAVLANMACTVDHLSGGRLTFTGDRSVETRFRAPAFSFLRRVDFAGPCSTY